MRYKAYGQFVFGDMRSLDYNAFSFYKNMFSAPTRDVTETAIPGRNGLLVYDNGRYNNRDIEYRLQIEGMEDISDFRAKVLSKTGYHRLEDTYEPDYYVMARVKNFSIDKFVGDAVSVALTFSCKPERRLKSGETIKQVLSGDSLYNPTIYNAFPLLHIYGNGTVTINDISLIVANNSGDLYVDCELQDAYKDNVNLNSRITLANDKFPFLRSGVNDITFTGITRLEITPRWWTI